jgi:hypothetical protein
MKVIYQWVGGVTVGKYHSHSRPGKRLGIHGFPLEAFGMRMDCLYHVGIYILVFPSMGGIADKGREMGLLSSSLSFKHERTHVSELVLLTGVG